MTTQLPDDTTIDWTIPEPRDGFLGEWDTFIGPGATRAENALFIVTALIAAAAIALYGILGPEDWPPLRIAVLALLGGDLAGGAVANASSATKRWYNRPEQGFAQHMGFIAVHVIYIALFSWLFRDLDVPYLIIASVALLASAALVLWLPLYLRRPVAALLTVCALVAGPLTSPPVLAWFLPVLWLKLIMGHATRDEPYRPLAEGASPSEPA
jgi:hypothetical protein